MDVNVEGMEIAQPSTSVNTVRLLHNAGKGTKDGQGFLFNIRNVQIQLRVKLETLLIKVYMKWKITVIANWMEF